MENIRKVEKENAKEYAQKMYAMYEDLYSYPGNREQSPFQRNANDNLWYSQKLRKQRLERMGITMKTNQKERQYEHSECFRVDAGFDGRYETLFIRQTMEGSVTYLADYCDKLEKKGRGFEHLR